MENRDSIDLSAIDWPGSLHCALRVEMHAACPMMGMRLKRCQVVEGHGGAGPAQKGEGGEETGKGSKGVKYERRAPGRIDDAGAAWRIWAASSLAEERRDRQRRRAKEQKARS